jgi:hypothetical protein
MAGTTLMNGKMPVREGKEERAMKEVEASSNQRWWKKDVWRSFFKFFTYAFCSLVTLSLIYAIVITSINSEKATWGQFWSFSFVALFCAVIGWASWEQAKTANPERMARLRIFGNLESWKARYYYLPRMFLFLSCAFFLASLAYLIIMLLR